MRKFVKLYNLKPDGVLHVGAHKGEEFKEYFELGFAEGNPIIWVEAQSNLVAQLRLNLDPKYNKIYEAVAWNESGVKMKFKVTSKTASSSLFSLGDHSNIYPDILVDEEIEVTTVRLDQVLEKDDSFELLVLDVQGAELQAIQGLGRRINKVKWIFTEVSKKELYSGATLYEELDQMLRDKGFTQLFVAWDRKAGWGDALYARSGMTTDKNLQIKIFKVATIARSYIPQRLFPFLVWVKTWYKRIIK